MNFYKSALVISLTIFKQIFSCTQISFCKRSNFGNFASTYFRKSLVFRYLENTYFRKLPFHKIFTKFCCHKLGQNSRNSRKLILTKTNSQKIGISNVEPNTNFSHLIDYLSGVFFAPLVNLYCKKPKVNFRNPIQKSKLLQL